MLEFHALSRRLLTAILREHPDSRISRVLLRDLDTPRDSAGPLTRVNRLWRALAAAAAGALCFAAAFGAFTVSERLPGLSRSSNLLMGVAFFAGMLGLLALVLTVRELLEDPFAPPSSSDCDHREA